MFPEYPYLNLNDLNLDYLLKRIRLIETKIQTIKEEIEGERNSYARSKNS